MNDASDGLHTFTPLQASHCNTWDRSLPVQSKWGGLGAKFAVQLKNPINTLPSHPQNRLYQEKDRMSPLHALATLLLVLSFAECTEVQSGKADDASLRKQATGADSAPVECILPTKDLLKDAPFKDNVLPVLFERLVKCVCAKATPETIDQWDTHIFGKDSLADSYTCDVYNTPSDYDWKKHARMRYILYLARRLIVALKNGFIVEDDCQKCSNQLLNDYYYPLLALELENMLSAKTISHLIKYSRTSEMLQFTFVNAFQRILAFSFKTYQITRAFERVSASTTVYSVRHAVSGLYEGQYVRIRRHKIRPYDHLISAITELLAAQKRPTYYGYLYSPDQNSDEFAVVELIGEETRLSLKPLCFSEDGNDNVDASDEGENASSSDDGSDDDGNDTYLSDDDK